MSFRVGRTWTKKPGRRQVLPPIFGIDDHSRFALPISTVLRATSAAAREGLDVIRDRFRTG